MVWTSSCKYLTFDYTINIFTLCHAIGIMPENLKKDVAVLQEQQKRQMEMFNTITLSISNLSDKIDWWREEMIRDYQKTENADIKYANKAVETVVKWHSKNLTRVTRWLITWLIWLIIWLLAFIYTSKIW